MVGTEERNVPSEGTPSKIREQILTENFTTNLWTKIIFLRKRYMEKRCHMIGPNHYQAKLGRGVGEAFTLFA